MMKGQFINEQQIERIRNLSESENGPFYAYDTKKIQQNCSKLMDVPYTPKSIHFAMMANSTPQFVELIKQSGLNVFVNSLSHLETAKELGYNGIEIVYAASAMDEETMRKAEKCGARVILDSFGQYNQWSSLFPDAGIGIRCNIGELVTPKNTLAGYFIGKESRLGLTIDSIEKLKGNSNVLGLHIYVGTNITDVNYFIDCYSQVVKLTSWFPNLQYLDFGGGFGIGEKSYAEFDMKSYGKKVSQLMKKVSDNLGRKIELILEPGRIIGADAGFFACKVVDIKNRNNQQLIGVNASCVQFPRPLFYPESAFHPVLILRKNGFAFNKPEVLSSIFGCSTYSRDFLANEIRLPQTSVGDIVIFGHAGSYCSSAYTSFLGFPKAKEYFL